MKFGFVTCVQLGFSCIEALYRAGASLDLVVTLEDSIAKNKSGRVFLDDFCCSKDLDLLKIKNINDPSVVNSIKQANLDWLFIIGWSQIAKSEILNCARFGVIGMHPTLLPEGRGRASIPWAILKKLDRTGVTAFQLDEGVDTGPILAQEIIDLDDNSDASSLYQLVNDAHSKLMGSVVRGLLQDSLTLNPQENSLATEWPGRTPKDGEIDLNSSVLEASLLVRASTKPYPGAHIHLESGKTLIVWKAKVVQHRVEGSPMVQFSDGWLQCLEFTYV